MFARRSLAVIVTLTVVGCSIAPPPAPTSWQKAMKEIERHFEVVKTELGTTPAGDLEAVARAATASARLMRHGYGEFHDKEVENFDRMARESESWLLRLAAEAGQGHGEIARDLFRGGEERHCTRCHDASGVQQW